MSPDLLRHLDAALRGHARALRRDGLPVPSCVVVAAETVATLRQVSTRLDLESGAAQAGGMAPLLLVKRDVAAQLGASERTVDRLIANGKLRAVRLSDGALRVRREDLDAFVAALAPVHGEVVAS